MSRQGYTTKPCHGCGSNEEHGKDKLCRDCQRIYDDGLLAREKQARQVSKMMVMHSSTSHWISRPYIFGNFASYTSSQLNDRLKNAWRQLTIAVIEPALGEKDHNAPYLVENKLDVWGTKNEFYAYDHDNYFLVAPEIRTAINELDLVIRIALEFVYLAGRQQGQSILTQLNEGMLSTSSFEDRVKKAETRLEQLKEKVCV